MEWLAQSHTKTYWFEACRQFPSMQQIPEIDQTYITHKMFFCFFLCVCFLNTSLERPLIAIYCTLPWGPLETKEPAACNRTVRVFRKRILLTLRSVTVTKIHIQIKTLQMFANKCKDYQ